MTWAGDERTSPGSFEYLDRFITCVLLEVISLSRRITETSGAAPPHVCDYGASVPIELHIIISRKLHNNIHI